MPLTLIATAGSSTANTYADIDTANAHFEGRTFATTWTDATDDTKGAALVQATQILDRLEWRGYKVNSTQALRWPRSGVLDQDGYEVDWDTIPSWLERATAELAMALMATDRTGDTADDYKRIKVGPIELDVNTAQVGQLIPAHVLSIIRPYRTGGAGVAVVRS